MYAVSFLVAERLLDDGSINSQTLQVTFDNNTVIGTFTPMAANGSSYVEFFTEPLRAPGHRHILGRRPHTIAITGTNTNGDNTVLIDEVTVTGESKLMSRHRSWEVASGYLSDTMRSGCRLVDNVLTRWRFSP